MHIACSETRRLSETRSSPGIISPRSGCETFVVWWLYRLIPHRIHVCSMYAIYGNIYHQYTPNVSIYTSTMDPMGYTIYPYMLDVWYIYLQNWVILDKGKCWDSYSSNMVRIWAMLYMLILSFIYYIYVYIYTWWVITIHVRVIPFENQPITVVFTVFTMVVIQKGS